MIKCKNSGKERFIAESLASQYRSVNSCGLLDDKMMDKRQFLHLSVILFNGVCGRWGGMHGKGVCMAGGHVWQGRHAWRGRGACMAGVCVAGGMHSRKDGHSSGRYTFYWNAFLYFIEAFVQFEERKKKDKTNSPFSEKKWKLWGKSNYGNNRASPLQRPTT